MKKIILLNILLSSFICNSQNWGNQILSQPNTNTGWMFGYCVSIDGDYAVIGSPAENLATGSAHVYKKDGNGNWNYIQKLEAYVGIHSYEYFGASVKIQGDYIFIGSPSDRLNEELFQTPAGSVFIYKNDGADNFVGHQRLRSSDASHGDVFGYSIDVSGDYLVVGDLHEDEDEDGFNFIGGAGAAYVFKKGVDDTWSEVQKIIPSQRAFGDGFGITVAIDGNFLIVFSGDDTDENNLNEPDAFGSVYIFKKNEGLDSWSEIQKLKTDNYRMYSDIDIDGNFIAVGANNEVQEDGIFYRGYVYVFKKNDNDDNWTQNEILRIQNSYEFGQAISMDNNFLLVSDPHKPVNINGSNITEAGKSYLYLKNDGSNSYELKETLIASEVQAYSHVGFVGYSNDRANYATEVSGNHLILGSRDYDRVVAGTTYLASGVAFISNNINNVLNEDIIWNGSEDNNWNNVLNWTPNTIPDQNHDVILENVANAPNIANGQNHTINNLTTFENLNIETNASLTIQGNVDQRAQITLNSAVDSNGSLIVNGNHTYPNPSNTIYNRFVTGDNSTWHLISSPLTNVDIDNFASNEPLAVGSNNANRGLSWYNNINENWEYYQDGAVDSGNFVVGKGYGINTSVDTSLEFSGVIKADNLEDYPIDVNANGWNIVGNPYTAYLRTNADTNGNINFLTENADQLDPAFANLYMWNPSTNSYEPVGNDSERAFIAPGQSFFVKAKNGGGLIKINKTMLNAQSNNTFLKQETSKKIEINLNSENNTSKSTIVFKKDMTTGLDVTYDAAVFDGTTNNHYVYSRILDGSFQLPFAIQFLPELNDNEYIIPLGLKSNDENLNLTFNSNISESVDIILEDKKFNIYTNINTNNGYEFQFNKDVDENRFFLHVQNKALNLENNVKDKISIYKNSESSLLIKGAINGILNIYTITGKKAIESKMIKESKQQIQLPRLKSGVYICEIKTNATKVVQKFIF